MRQAISGSSVAMASTRQERWDISTISGNILPARPVTPASGHGWPAATQSAATAANPESTARSECQPPPTFPEVETPPSVGPMPPAISGSSADLAPTRTERRDISTTCGDILRARVGRQASGRGWVGAALSPNHTAANPESTALLEYQPPPTFPEVDSAPQAGPIRPATSGSLAGMASTRPEREDISTISGSTLRRLVTRASGHGSVAAIQSAAAAARSESTAPSEPQPPRTVPEVDSAP